MVPVRTVPPVAGGRQTLRARRASSAGTAATITVRPARGQQHPAGGECRASLLDQALTTRPDAPYGCKGGVWGTCRARSWKGAVEMDVNYALEPDELVAGAVLTCQARPKTDTVRLEFL